MRGAQFSATLNSKSALASCCREQTSVGTLCWKRHPEVWDSLFAATLYHLTPLENACERARKLHKPMIQVAIFEKLSLILLLPPF